MANKIIRSDGFEQIIDGEGFSLESKEVFKLKCCDCGLVHKMVLVSQDGNDIGVAMERIGEPPSSPTEHIKEYYVPSNINSNIFKLEKGEVK